MSSRKVTIHLSEELDHRLRMYSAENYVTKSEVAEVAIAQFLDWKDGKQEPKKKKEKS